MFHKSIRDHIRKRRTKIEHYICEKTNEANELFELYRNRSEWWCANPTATAVDSAGFLLNTIHAFSCVNPHTDWVPSISSLKEQWQSGIVPFAIFKLPYCLLCSSFIPSCTFAQTCLRMSKFVPCVAGARLLHNYLGSFSANKITKGTCAAYQRQMMDEMMHRQTAQVTYPDHV